MTSDPGLATFDPYAPSPALMLPVAPANVWFDDGVGGTLTAAAATHAGRAVRSLPAAAAALLSADRAVGGAIDDGEIDAPAHAADAALDDDDAPAWPVAEALDDSAERVDSLALSDDDDDVVAGYAEIPAAEDGPAAEVDGQWAANASPSPEAEADATPGATIDDVVAADAAVPAASGGALVPASNELGPDDAGGLAVLPESLAPAAADVAADEGTAAGPAPNDPTAAAVAGAGPVSSAAEVGRRMTIDYAIPGEESLPDVPHADTVPHGGHGAPAAVNPASLDDVSDAADPTAVEAAGEAAGESYQSHFLEDADDEPEYVAHVEPTPRPTAPSAVAAVPVDARPQAGPETLAADASAVATAVAEPTVAEATAPTADGRGTFRRPAKRKPRADRPGQVPADDATPTDPEVEAIHPASVRRGAGPSARGRVAAAEADSDAEVGEPVDPAAGSERGGADEAEASVGVEAPADPGAADEAVRSAAPIRRRAAADGGGGGGGWWTIPLLCAGLAVIACCVVIPQADANRRLAYERSALRADLESVQAQVATNDDFLQKLAGDPTLAERLAGRQLNLTRSGTRVLPIRGGDQGTSPFDLVRVAPPSAVEPYAPVGGRVAEVCRNVRARLYLTGAGLFVLAAGLVLGGGGERRPASASPSR